MATKNWRSPAQVAEELEVTERTVRRWCELGRLSAMQMPSGRWRIYRTRKDLTDALKAAETALAAATA